MNVRSLHSRSISTTLLATALALATSGCPQSTDTATASTNNPAPPPGTDPAGRMKGDAHAPSSGPVAMGKPGADLGPATEKDVKNVMEKLVGSWSMALPGPEGNTITQTLVFTENGEFQELNVAGEQTRKQMGTFRISKGTPARFAVEIKVAAMPMPVTNVYQLADDGGLVANVRGRDFRFERAADADAAVAK